MVNDIRAWEAEQAPAPRPERLRGSLGVGSIVFMVVAAAAPLTVVAGTVPIGIAVGNGGGFPTTYVICCAVLMLFAVGFTTMTRHVPRAGGFYSYIALGLGRSPGLGAAFLALLSYIAILVAVYGYIGAALGDLVLSYGGPDSPWWAWSTLVVAVVAFLGHRQIDLSSKVLGALLVAEVVVVVVLDLFIVARGGGTDGFSAAALDLESVTSGAPGIAVMFALAGFLGFEATVVFRDESRDPDRTIPRATYLSLLLIGSFYAVSSWAIVSAWGAEEVVARAAAEPGTMVTETASSFVGGMAADIIGVLLVSSLMAAALSFHNVASRYLFSLGNTRVLPRSCGRSHVTHGSPYVASLLVSVVSAVAIAGSAAGGLDPVAEVFAWLAGIATVGVVALMLLTCLAVVVFFRRNDLDDRLWHTRVAPLAGLLALGVCLYLTVSNLSVLVGGSTRLAVVIGAVLAAAFLAGPLLAALRPQAGTSQSLHPTHHKELSS